MGNKRIEKFSSGTDPELISMIAKELNISVWETKKILNVTIDSVRKCIDLNGYVNLRRLGRLFIKPRKRSRFKNFRGKIIEIPVMYMVRFKSSDSMRRFVNRKLAKDRDDAKRNNFS